MTVRARRGDDAGTGTRLPVWIVVVVAVGVALVTGTAIVLLQARADHARHTALILHQISDAVNEDRWLLYEGVAKGEVDQELEDDIRMADALVVAGIAELAAVDRGAAAVLTTAYESYEEDYFSRYHDLIVAGRGVEVLAGIEAEEDAPNALEDIVESLVADYDRRADQASDQAKAGTIVSLVLAALGIGGMYGRHAQRSATASAALRRSEARIRAMLDASPDMLVRIGGDGTIRDVQASDAAALNADSPTLIGRPLDNVMPAEVADRAMAKIARTLETGDMQIFEYQLPGAGGERELEARLVVSALDEVLAVVRDVTDRRRAEAEVRFQAQLLEQVTAAVVATDEGGTVTHWNRHAEDLFGWSKAEAMGCDLRDLTVGHHDAVQVGAIFARVLAGQQWDGEMQARCRDGSTVSVQSSHAPLRDAAGAMAGLVGVAVDITERRRLEAQLTHQAFHDSLTGLPNRALFLDRLEHALVRAGRHRRSVAVLFLDLDHFKVVNDSMGHEAGDRLLIGAARRLSECLRVGDTLSRFGGDEFALLLEDLTDAGEAIDLAERIARGLRAPFSLEGREVVVSASIGLVLGDEPCSPADLLRDADVALYAAKRKGRAGYALFDQTMNALAWERLEMEGALRRAVASGELRVHFQPLVDLASGRIGEVEALVRWEHPDHGLLAPAEFISLAEETGLIVPLGYWVLEAACRQVRAWHITRPGEPPLGLSVNVSARQLHEPGLTDEIARILTETGLAPCLLKLEITETVAMDDDEASGVVLHALKAIGVRLAVDDFGTGYAALSYFRRCPVDTLKIDRSYVAGMAGNAEDAMIVRAVVAFAKTMALSVTAEGIETAEQLEQVRALGCDRGQGYYFARPLPAEDLAALLDAAPSWPVTTGGRPMPVLIGAAVGIDTATAVAS